MKTYKKYDIKKAKENIDEINWKLEELFNCPENKDGELKADHDSLMELAESVQTLKTYLDEIHLI